MTTKLVEISMVCAVLICHTDITNRDNPKLQDRSVSMLDMAAAMPQISPLASLKFNHIYSCRFSSMLLSMNPSFIHLCLQINVITIIIIFSPSFFFLPFCLIIYNNTCFPIRAEYKSLNNRLQINE